VLAAGWNTEQASFGELDKRGKAWRKAELISLEELCALNGQPLSKFMAKMRELLRRAGSAHTSFLGQSLGVPLTMSSQGSLDRFCCPHGKEARPPVDESILRSGNCNTSDKRRRRWSTDQRTQGEHARFSQLLRPSLAQVICIDDDSSDVQEPMEMEESTLYDAALAELVQMGFVPALAKRALSASRGAIPEAIEILCRN